MDTVSISEKDPSASIFAEIKEAEKSADEILQNAAKEKEKIIRDARQNSSSLTLKRFEETDKEKAKKIQSFQANVYVLKETTLSDAREQIKKTERKSQKEMQNAIEAVFSRFTDYITKQN